MTRRSLFAIIAAWFAPKPVAVSLPTPADRTDWRMFNDGTGGSTYFITIDRQAAIRLREPQ